MCWQLALYSTLRSFQVKKKESEELFERKLVVSFLCFIIHSKGSSAKGLSCETEIYVIAVVFLVCTHVIKIEKIFASSSKYFVCFNKFYAEKGFCNVFRPNERPKIKFFSDL